MNTPKIRFKGFADDWEQRKLGELAEIIGKMEIMNPRFTSAKFTVGLIVRETCLVCL